jgi:hypothetical protein
VHEISSQGCNGEGFLLNYSGIMQFGQGKRPQIPISPMGGTPTSYLKNAGPQSVSP